MVQRMRDNHDELDFKAANTRTRNNYPNSQLMRSVVNKYTPACFAFIHRQYDLSFKYYYEEDTTKGSALNKFSKFSQLKRLMIIMMMLIMIMTGLPMLMFWMQNFKKTFSQVLKIMINLMKGLSQLTLGAKVLVVHVVCLRTRASYVDMFSRSWSSWVVMCNIMF